MNCWISSQSVCEKAAYFGLLASKMLSFDKSRGCFLSALLTSVPLVRIQWFVVSVSVVRRHLVSSSLSDTSVGRCYVLSSKQRGENQNEVVYMAMRPKKNEE
jgi:hypothetical protein